MTEKPQFDRIANVEFKKSLSTGHHTDLLKPIQQQPAPPPAQTDNTNNKKD